MSKTKKEERPSFSGPMEQLPEDPSSPCYLVICYVCKELAKPDEEHGPHYGGTVCFSCRAFFRRAHQKSRNPQFVCKNNNRCEIGVANRRRCQRCRHERCIKAGMNPDAVLTEEERNLRFRKTLERKRRREESRINNQSSAESTNDDEDVSIHETSTKIAATAQLNSEISSNDLENLLNQLPTPSSSQVVEIISNLDNFERSKELPVLDGFIHQVFDPNVMSKSVRESSLEEIILGNINVDSFNCTISSRAEEFHPKPGTSKGFQQTIQYDQLTSESSKLEEIIRKFDAPSSMLAEQPSKLEELISNYNTESTSQNELIMESQFTNSLLIDYNLNVNSHPEFILEPSMSEEDKVRNDFKGQSCQNTSSSNKAQGTEGLVDPCGSSEFKNTPSILEELVKNPNSDYSKRNEKALKSSSTSKAPLLEELIQFFDNSNQENKRSATLGDLLIETDNSGLEPDPQSVTPNTCRIPMESFHNPCNTKTRFPISSNEVVKTNKIEESTLFQLEPIIQSYAMSIGQSNKFTTALRFGMNAVFDHVGQLTEQYSKFASLQRSFTNLSKRDQDTLLARNAPLFIQFCFGCDFIDDNNITKDQHSNFISTGVQKVLKENPTLVINSSNSLSQLFKTEADESFYRQMINKLGSIKKITSVKMRSLLSFCILFATDKTLELVHRDIIEKIGIKNEKFFQNKLSDLSISLEHLFSTLSRMAAFSAFNISWNHHQFGLSSLSQLVLPYTEEEESWLDQQFRLLDEAHGSVSFGEDTTREFMLYSLDVPVSKTYMKGVFNVALERMWRAYKMHPEFEELPVQTQLELMNRNGPGGLALTVAKYENCQFGVEQIRYAFGAMEEEKWKQDYMPILTSMNKIKKMEMKDVVFESSIPLSPEQLNQFYDLINDFKDVVTDPVYFKLVTLLALTRPRSFDMNNDLEHLKSKYELVLQRRTKWMFRSAELRQRGSIFHKMRNPETLIQKIFVCINNLDKLAEILLFIKDVQ